MFIQKEYETFIKNINASESDKFMESDEEEKYLTYEMLDYYMGTKIKLNEKIETIERAIYAITKDNSRAINMIRISLSHHNTLEEIDKLVEKLESIRNL